MTSTATGGSPINLSALVTDSIDATIRLLGDVQRFGFRLCRAEVRDHAGCSLVTLSLASNGTVDPDLLRARLARHPCVTWVTVGRPAVVLSRVA